MRMVTIFCYLRISTAPWLCRFGIHLNMRYSLIMHSIYGLTCPFYFFIIFTRIRLSFLFTFLLIVNMLYSLLILSCPCSFWIKKELFFILPLVIVFICYLFWVPSWRFLAFYKLSSYMM